MSGCGVWRHELYVILLGLLLSLALGAPMDIGITAFDSNKATIQMIENGTTQMTENATRPMTVNATTQMTENVTSQTTGKATRPMTVNATNQMTKIATTQTTVTQRRVEKTTKKFVPRQVFLEVFVKTGSPDGGGSDGYVFLNVRGSRGWSGNMELDDCKNNFEKGHTDVFYLRISDVGAIREIRIGHDDVGSGSGWYLDTITIRRFIDYDDMEIFDSRDTVPLHSYERYYFAYHNWLPPDEGDGSVWRNLKPTSAVSLITV